MEAYSTSFKHLSNLKDYVGKELGLTEWLTISQERVNIFADNTEDRQWIHVDVERAKRESPYKTPIAHGFLILSLGPRLLSSAFKIDDVVIGINYGLDKVRFISATKVGAKLRARVTLVSFREIPNGARFKLLVRFELKDEEKPACIAEFISQCYTK